MMLVSLVARLLEANHEDLRERVVRVSQDLDVAESSGAIVGVVLDCDDRLAQGFLYACAESPRFKASGTRGSAVAAIAVNEVVRFLDIAGQDVIVHALRNAPPFRRFWALGIGSGSVMLESQSL